MQSNDDTKGSGADSHGSDRPAFGTRADYLELNKGNDVPPAPDRGDDAVAGGPELLDRLHDVYDTDTGPGSDPDARP